MPTRLGDLVLRQAEFFTEMLISLRLFQRIQIGTLHILNQRHLQHLLRRDIFDHYRHAFRSPARWAARQRRSPATISY